MLLEVEGWKHNAGRTVLLNNGLSSAVSYRDGALYADRTYIKKLVSYRNRKGARRKSAVSIYLYGERLRLNGNYQVRIHLSQSDVAKLFAEVFAGCTAAEMVEELQRKMKRMR